MRTRRSIVTAMTTLAMVPALAGHATGGGLVVDDPSGDARWVDPAPNAAWADLTQVRVASVRDGSGAVTALQFAWVTAEAPPDGDEHRPFFVTGWELLDDGEPRCTGAVQVLDTRPGSTWGGPQALVHSTCDGDDNGVNVHLDAKVIQTDVGVLTKWGGAATPTRDGTTVTVDVPLSMFANGLSNGRYHEGTRLSGIEAESGVIVGTACLTVDRAGSETPLEGGRYEYRIGD
jgi:hypothetical protein